MLDLSHRKLNKLPDIPDNTTHLDISYNNIKSIDKLPSKLVYLNCSFNQLKSLPVLPKTLTYLNISHNQFPKAPSVNTITELFDDHNLYNTPTAIKSGTCFDFNLNDSDSLDFYFISSKDNIIIKFRNRYICYNRRDLRFINIKDDLYEFEDSLFEGIQINEKNKNQLKSRYYSLYNIIEDSKTPEVIPYKREEFLLLALE